MRKRFTAAGLSILLGAFASVAQPPQLPLYPVAPPPPPGVYTPPAPLAPQAVPQPPPRPLPPSVLQPPPVSNVQGTPTLGETPLPHPEHKQAIQTMDVQVKRVRGGWQVWNGQNVLRDLGENEMQARDVVRVLRDLRPTEWVAIGGPTPIVEYGLTNGRPASTAAPPDGKDEPKAGAGMAGRGIDGPVVTGAGARLIQPIDIRSARVEAIRGVWCVRDDNNILFNFGSVKADAEQTVAVIQKYGFNRIGVVGTASQPVMNYLFVSHDEVKPNPLGVQAMFNAQINELNRTGIPIPGVGFTGEMVKIEPRKVEARKEGAEWVVAYNREVLGRFGQTEWAARDAARTIQDARFTEFCKLGGTTNLTFFLRGGKAPTRAPFNAQGRNFDLNTLKVQQLNGNWIVSEGNKLLFEVGSQQEGEVVVSLLKAYGFDQFARLSSGGATGGITFLIKNR